MIIPLNIVNLDGGKVIIKSGNLQDKEVEITENGTIEVAPDSGFSGLEKVTINTEVKGGEPSIPDDGKTRLYISVPKGRQDLPLYFSQTIANGVTIDWGDGSATETFNETDSLNTIHHYDKAGDYIVSFDVADGCILNFGSGNSSYGIFGNPEGSGKVYSGTLKRIVIGKNIQSLKSFAFNGCQGLSSIVMSEGITSIGRNLFYSCSSLSSVVMSQNITYIQNYTFQYCYSLASIVLPSSLGEIGGNVFEYCYGVAFYDFSAVKKVPILLPLIPLYSVEKYKFLVA